MKVYFIADVFLSANKEGKVDAESERIHSRTIFSGEREENNSVHKWKV